MSESLQAVEVANSINSLALIGEPVSSPEPVTSNNSSSKEISHEEVSKSPESGAQKGPEGTEEVKQEVLTSAGEEEREKGSEDNKKTTTHPSPLRFSAKKGDEALELAEDTLLTFKVDKQDDYQITLRDLIRQHQGKIPIEKHMGQLKQEKLALESERRQFEEERGVVEKEVGEIVTLLKSNPKKALEKIVLMAGGNPGEYEAIYADEVNDMNEREKALFLREKALEHREEADKRKASKIKEETETQKTAEVITRTIVDGQKQYGISDEEVKTSWDYVLSMANAKKINLGQMTPEQIGNTVIRHIMENLKPQALFEKAAKEVGWKHDVTPQDVSLLKGLLTPDMAWEDVADIVRAYYDLEDNKKISKSGEVQPETSESSKGRAAKQSSAKPPTPPKTPQKPKVREADEEDEMDRDDNPLTFDDLLRSAERKRGLRR